MEKVELKDFGVTLMSEFAITAQKAGFLPKDIAFLAHKIDTMIRIHGVIMGTHKIIEIGKRVNMSRVPYIPEGWKIVEQNDPGGVIDLDEVDFISYVPKIKKGKKVSGNELKSLTAGKYPCNANLLDYYLEHEDSIPDEWEYALISGIYFFGTIFKDKQEVLHVAGLKYEEGKYVRMYVPLSHEFTLIEHDDDSYDIIAVMIK